MNRPRWDIFCRVVDNYGDAGVCWRLARQLSAEHGLAVRLWVDGLPTLQALQPDSGAGVDIRPWPSRFPDTTPAEVVIAAFGCTLPENYVAAMVQAHDAPVWINLEYLSAEPWVEHCHKMASPHPRLPLTSYFFFPGFTPNSGGLLREQGLQAAREQHHAARFLQKLGLPETPEGAATVSLFCYGEAPWPALFDAWSQAATPVRCLVPAEGAAPAVAAGLHPRLAPGNTVQQGNLTLHGIPFLSQPDYDRLLWSCDCNFVRGEDSFVRAQWAARPMVWQAYAQAEAAHLVKLDAFLDRYLAGLDPAAATAWRAFHRAWNTRGRPDWDALWRHHAQLQSHATHWTETLCTLPDLASNLVIFCKNPV